ncbi:hypothetical protein J6590_005915 [Homalodisca vitripennis]|nr:hypothetical protein J6590_005915 [Homalodisca vitripennis]
MDSRHRLLFYLNHLPFDQSVYRGLDLTDLTGNGGGTPERPAIGIRCRHLSCEELQVAMLVNMRAHAWEWTYCWLTP